MIDRATSPDHTESHPHHLEHDTELGLGHRTVPFPPRPVERDAGPSVLAVAPAHTRTELLPARALAEGPERHRLELVGEWGTSWGPFFTSDFPVAIERGDDVRVLNGLVPLTPTLALRICPDVNVRREKCDFQTK